MLAGCVNTPVKQKETVFALDSILNAQNNNLLLLKATLSKEVLMDGKEEMTNFLPEDSSAWASEFQIFQQINSINKPINLGVYTETVFADSSSNLTIRRLKTERNLPLKELKVYYLENPSKIRKVEGYISESNALYSSARILSMHFSDVYNKTLLTSYSVKGGQHMILGDTVQFDIQSTIRIN